MYTKLWLDYVTDDNGTVVSCDDAIKDSPVIQNAINELKSCVYLKDLNIVLELTDDGSLGDEGYRISTSVMGYRIEAKTQTGLIFGSFRFIALYRLNDGGNINVTEVPVNKLRMLNHWDNMDGSIERGYSGDSFFFVDNDLVINERTRDYARILCSLGINGVVINNVNVKGAACDLINDRFINKVRELEALFSSFGIKLFMCLNYAAPIEDPDVASADPLDPKVINWWDKKFDEVYSVVPGLGGFLVKADSEGRPGPFTYGRTQAEGANLLARAIKKHGGSVGIHIRD